MRPLNFRPPLESIPRGPLPSDSAALYIRANPTHLPCLKIAEAVPLEARPLPSRRLTTRRKPTFLAVRKSTFRGAGQRCAVGETSGPPADKHPRFTLPHVWGAKHVPPPPIYTLCGGQARTPRLSRALKSPRESSPRVTTPATKLQRNAAASPSSADYSP